MRFCINKIQPNEFGNLSKEKPITSPEKGIWLSCSIEDIKEPCPFLGKRIRKLIKEWKEKKVSDFYVNKK